MSVNLKRSKVIPNVIYFHKEHSWGKSAAELQLLDSFWLGLLPKN